MIIDQAVRDSEPGKVYPFRSIGLEPSGSDPRLKIQAADVRRAWVLRQPQEQPKTVAANESIFDILRRRHGVPCNSEPHRRSESGLRVS